MPLPSLRKSSSSTTRATSGATKYLGLILITLFVAFIEIIYLMSTSDGSPLITVASARKHSEQPVFSLLVTLQFAAVEYKDKFLKDIQPVADHVKTSEPDTLSYEVLLSDKDPLHVLVLERYRDKEVAYLQVHKSSAPFLAFRPKLQALQETGHVTVSGNSYLDAGIGFGDRPSMKH